MLWKDMALPYLPREARAIWTKFLRLSRRREWSDWGSPCLIKHSEIVAFQRLTGAQFTPWEIDQIEILDSVYISVIGSQRENS